MGDGSIKKPAFCFVIFFAASCIYSAKAFAMHISEGILPLPWAGLWSLAALPFLAKGILDIKKKSKENINLKPLLGLMGALVFVISCMPVPVPTAGTCSHPAGTGISAVLLGPVLSIFITSIALLIQALFLAHGGLTTWGADIVSMGIAGSFAAYFSFRILQKLKAPLFVCGFTAGLLADWATYAMTSFELASALHGSRPFSELFITIGLAFIPTQLPLGILEGFLTGGMIVFVAKRRPDILASLGVIKNINASGHGLSGSSRKNNPGSLKAGLNRVIGLGFIITMLIGGIISGPAYSQEQGKWPGVDETVVERIAREQGRGPWQPFINTDQGDLLLFVFLIAGVCGGFVMGYYWNKLFVNKAPCDKRSI